MPNFKLFGVIVDVVLIVIGSLLGLLIMRLTRKKGGKNGEKTQRVMDSLLKVLGLCAIFIGICGAIEGTVNGRITDVLGDSGIQVDGISTEHTLVIIVSMVLGTLVGEIINLDGLLNKFGGFIQCKIKGENSNVTQGFVMGFMMLGVGSLTLVGALNSGLRGDHTMLITKSIMDFVTALALASTMGIGVLLSSAFVFVYEGSLVLLAGSVAGIMSADVVTCISSVGSLIIIGLGLNVVTNGKMRTTNCIPAIFFPLALVPLYDWAMALL